MSALDSLKVTSAPAALADTARAHNALADLIASMIGQNGVNVTVSEGRILIEGERTPTGGGSSTPSTEIWVPDNAGQLRSVLAGASVFSPTTYPTYLRVGDTYYAALSSGVSPSLVVSNGSDTTTAGINVLSVVNGSDSATVTKTSVAVVNGSDSSTVTKTSVAVVNGSDSSTMTKTSVAVVNGSDSATMTKNSVAVANASYSIAMGPQILTVTNIGSGKTLTMDASAITHDMTIREIDVCDGGVAKKMIVIGSAPY